MRLEDEIFGALSALVDGRVYPLVAPPDPVAPYIVYFQLEGHKDYTLTGPSGAKQVRMQVSLYCSETAPYAAFGDLTDEVCAAVEKLGGQLIGDGRERLVATRVRHARQDFLLWDRR